MTDIHPNAPARLVKRFYKAGSFHKLADELKVNVRWVYELLTNGSEPTDRTAKGRDIRKRLYLPARKRRPRTEPQPRPDHLKWWQQLGAQARDLLIKQLHDINKDRIP